MTINTPYLQVSRDASLALTEFADDFRSALTLADFELWAESLGYSRATDALKSVFPIPIDAAGYKEFKGDMKYRTLYERSLSMIQKRWQDGVEEFADVIEAPDFVDFAGAPARMALEWKRQPNLLVADLLATAALDGPILDFYTDKDSGTQSTRRLFAGDHPYNVLKTGLGSFDNRMTTTVADIKSGAFFDSVSAYFRKIKGPNGKPLGLRMGGGNFLVPVEREQLFKVTLETDTLIRAVAADGTISGGSGNVAAVTQNNIYKGSYGYTVADELEDQDHFYAFASGGDPMNVPWVVQTSGSPEEIIHDKTSEKYKSTRKVAIAYLGKMNVSGCLPHRIVRVQITG